MNAYRPDPVVVAEQARLRKRRGRWVSALGVLLVLSLVLPHVHLPGRDELGRSLLTTSFYFLHINAGVFDGPVNQAELAWGFNLTYLGLALHQFGLLLSLFTFWSLYPDEINRWIYRILVVGGWLLALSSPLVIIGFDAIQRAGVPAALGVAWLPVVVSGLAIIIASRRAKGRVDRTWYAAKHELM